MSVSIFFILFLFLLTPVHCYHSYDQLFCLSSHISLWRGLICLQWWEHFPVSAPLVWSACCQDACVYQKPISIYLLKWEMFSTALLYCLSDALFHLQLLEAVCKFLRLKIFSIWFNFIGHRETGADGIDASPRPARMGLSPQSGQGLVMNSRAGFIVCWYSVGILHKCVPVMPWQEVFECDCSWSE